MQHGTPRDARCDARGTRATCTYAHILSSCLRPPPPLPPRRSLLHDNSLAGSLPSEIGLLTALTELCAPDTSRRSPHRTRQRARAPAPTSVRARACDCCSSLPLPNLPLPRAQGRARQPAGRRHPGRARAAQQPAKAVRRAPTHRRAMATRYYPRRRTALLRSRAAARGSPTRARSPQTRASGRACRLTCAASWRRTISSARSLPRSGSSLAS